jgi:hypothetical protein
MLFDLRGRRRRAVQATYLTLALLMGGGLVLFGIGGDVSGGLFDAFSERGGGGKALVRDNYQLATAQTESTSVGFPNEAKDELAKAGAYWDRYLDGEPERPDASLAAVALQIFDVTALNRPRKAQRAAAIIANEQEEPASYLRLVQYAALAGDTRTADLAAQKAVDLAPKEEKKQVKEQAEQLKKPQAQTQPQGG